MKWLLLSVLTATSVAHADQYTCNVSITETIKVKLVTHKAVENIDYRLPIDPKLILSEQVINKEGLQTDPAKYGYTATSQGEIAKVLFTYDLKRPIASFSFDDDLKLATRNTNKGYEDEYYMAMFDAKGKKLTFGTHVELKAVDRIPSYGFTFTSYNFVKYNANSDRYTLQLNLMKIGFGSDQTVYMYDGSAGLRFKKGATEISGDVSTQTGFNNVDNLADTSVGDQKNDSMDVTCVLK